ncbi:MAG: bifunctional homocysteine S-methyltransferase/methylenetetrahydrofolate reductase [Deltaproteobacteria bacterium]|jgi:homocysteine S-methyltransferase|nr:bifunctional homocysteine S-methyltransferase/methylenetetrahydrofolate reductase [Deltaproteobacteria bacterium]
MNTRQEKLLDRLKHGPVIIADGGMGTHLYHLGAPHDAVFEYLNIIDPQLVSRVHDDYAEAGAQFFETNTFGANRIRLSAYGLEDKSHQINLAGARLARAVAGNTHWVAGSIGPIGKRQATSEFTENEKKSVFREQMTALAEGGVDCFLLETFSSVSDLLLALAVATEFCFPTIAQIAFSEGGHTGDGLTAEAAAECLTAASPTVIGTNCGFGPRELLSILKRLAAATNVPLSAFPNSGFPEYVNGRHIYLATPEYFATIGKEMVTAGVNLIGGCCGTGPDHIRALRQHLTHHVPGPRLPIECSQNHIASERMRESKSSHFLSRWGKQPVITVELDLPKGIAVQSVLKKARILQQGGVDAINLAENPLARIRMGNLALASKIQDETSLDVIVHVTARDRNLIGLHSELMGAHLLGIRSVLAVTGDPVSSSGDGGATNVFDVNSIGLLKILSALNHGQTLYGVDISGQTGFLLGAAFNPNVSDLSGQLLKLEKKIAAGAQFVQTQPIYSHEILERLLTTTRDVKVPILIGILPLVSERNAEFLHNEVPGIQLPENVRTRMRGKSGEAGIEEGLQIARELIGAAQRASVGGFYLIPPFGKVDLALSLAKEIRGGGH